MQPICARATSNPIFFVRHTFANFQGFEAFFLSRADPHVAAGGWVGFGFGVGVGNRVVCGGGVLVVGYPGWKPGLGAEGSCFVWEDVEESWDGTETSDNSTACGVIFRSFRRSYFLDYCRILDIFPMTRFWLACAHHFHEGVKEDLLVRQRKVRGAVRLLFTSRVSFWNILKHKTEGKRNFIKS